MLLSAGNFLLCDVKLCALSLPCSCGLHSCGHPHQHHLLRFSTGYRPNRTSSSDDVDHLCISILHMSSWYARLGKERRQQASRRPDAKAMRPDIKNDEQSPESNYVILCFIKLLHPPPPPGLAPLSPPPPPPAPLPFEGNSRDLPLISPAPATCTVSAVTIDGYSGIQDKSDGCMVLRASRLDSV